MPHDGTLWSSLFSLLLLLLVGACDGSGRLAGNGDTGPMPPGADVPEDGPRGDPPDAGPHRELPGPGILVLEPLPLSETGPAFWMEGTVRPDGLLEVELRGRALMDLVGFAVWISWEPDLLDLEEVEASAPIGDPEVVARGVAVSPGPGWAVLGVTRFPKEPDPWNPQPVGLDVPAEIPVGRLVLHPRAPGETVLRFDPSRRVARRSDRQEIPCAWGGLRVRIGGSP